MEEELAEAIAKKKNKVVPQGMSEYQASWIPDEDGGILLSYLLNFFSFSFKLKRIKKNI